MNSFSDSMEKAMDKENSFLKYDPEVRGVTQSLLTSWMTCPTKARAHLKGLYVPGYSKPLMWGSVYHQYLEFTLNDVKTGVINHPDQFKELETMNRYRSLVRDHFNKQFEDANGDGKEIIEEAIIMGAKMIPLYFEYWREDFFGDSKKKWLEIERVFSQKVAGISLRGRRDGVYENNGVWLFENKTKAQIKEDDLLKVIPRDFQVLCYMLSYYLEHQIYMKGVLYNVIRRPQLRKTAKESFEGFYRRCELDVIKRPEWYFMRFEVAIDPQKLLLFSKKLNKLILDFREWWDSDEVYDEERTHNCIGPYGSCPYIDYCASDKTDLSLLDVHDDFFLELK